MCQVRCFGVQNFVGWAPPWLVMGFLLREQIPFTALWLTFHFSYSRSLFFIFFTKREILKLLSMYVFVFGSCSLFTFVKYSQGNTIDNRSKTVKQISWMNLHLLFMGFIFISPFPTEFLTREDSLFCIVDNTLHHFDVWITQLELKLSFLTPLTCSQVSSQRMTMF